MSILGAFLDLEPMQALLLLNVVAIVAILGFKGFRYAVKYRNRGKIWMIY